MDLGQLLLQRLPPPLLGRQAAVRFGRERPALRKFSLQLPNPRSVDLFRGLQRFLALACLLTGAVDLGMGAILNGAQVRGLGDADDLGFIL